MAECAAEARGRSRVDRSRCNWLSTVRALEADLLVDETQQMMLGNLIFQTEGVEQGFRTGVMSLHDEQASENENPARHGQELFPCNMLLPHFYPLIIVPFSTPTDHFTNYVSAAFVRCLCNVNQKALTL